MSHERRRLWSGFLREPSHLAGTKRPHPIFSVVKWHISNLFLRDFLHVEYVVRVVRDNLHQSRHSVADRKQLIARDCRAKAHIIVASRDQVAVHAGAIRSVNKSCGVFLVAKKSEVAPFSSRSPVDSITNHGFKGAGNRM